MTFDNDYRFVKLLHNQSPEELHLLFFKIWFEKSFNILGDQTFSSSLSASPCTAINFATENKECSGSHFNIVHVD